MQHKRNHKALLPFLSTQNPILLEMRSIERGSPVKEINKKNVHDLTGVRSSVMANWEKGEAIDDVRAARLFTDTMHKLDELVRRRPPSAHLAAKHEDLRRRIQAYSVLYEDPMSDVHDAAQILQLPTSECQQIVDDFIYAKGPVLPALYYAADADSTQAQDDFDSLAGQYMLWVRRGSDLWLQAPLHVRYLKKLGDGLFIRCKLNFPILNGDLGTPNKDEKAPPYWEYDGAVALRAKRMTWFFEKRSRTRNDYFQFITQRHHADGHDRRLYVGQYLTTDQDIDQSVVSGPVLLRHQFSDPKDTYQLRYRDAMRTQARVLAEPALIAEADETWRKFGPIYGGKSLM